jgi:predicted MFS family arabinose efflux permease
LLKAIFIMAINALSYRDYRIFWAGSVISRCGDGIQEVAEDWLVFVMTGSPFLLGLVAFCKAPSRIILAPIFGAIIDRVDRKKLMIALYFFQIALTLVYGALITTKLILFWHIVVLTILDSLVAPLIRVTRQTVIPELVPKESLLSAISLNSVGNNTAQVVGPFLGGILILWLGVDGVFYLNAVSFVAIIASFFVIRMPEKQAEAGKLEIMRDVREGLHFIKNHALILDVMVMQFISFFLALPFTRLFPVYAKDILNIGPTGLGLLKGALAGGSVIGGLGLLSFGDIKNKERLMMITALATALFLTLFAYAKWLPYSLACLVVIGITSIILRATGLTVIQLNVPDEFRGRVMGLYHLEAGFRSFGALLYGAMASWVGTPMTVLLGGVVFGFLSFCTPYFRKRTRPAAGE